MMAALFIKQRALIIIYGNLLYIVRLCSSLCCQENNIEVSGRWNGWLCDGVFSTMVFCCYKQGRANGVFVVASLLL